MTYIKSISTYIIILTFIILAACSEKQADTLVYGQESLDSVMEELSKTPEDIELNRFVWKFYTEKGEWDKLLSHAVPVFENAQRSGNMKLMLSAGTFIAQTFIFKEDFNAANRYLSFLTENMALVKDDHLLYSMINNVAAINAIKTQLDYSAASEYYEEAYRASVKSHNIPNQCVSLCNIASIYYIREDSLGFKFARMAYELSHRNDTPTRLYSQTLSCIILAQMYCLKKDTENAMTYVKEAEENILHFPQFEAALYLLKADICVEKGDTSCAGRLYMKAVECNSASDPGTCILAWWKYGKMLASQLHYAEASEVLRKGLELSDNIGNIEYRHRILYELSDIAMKMNDMDMAMDYYKQYHNQVDSISHIQRDKAFQQYLVLKQQHEVQTKELELEHSRKKISIMLIVLAFIIIITATVIISNIKLNKAYRKLVILNQKLLSEKNRKQKTAESDSPLTSTNSRDIDLWHNVEQALLEEKMYRDSDISLDKLASRLATNRAYISKVINQFSGMSFYNYIHTHRIDDAVKILSDCSNDIPLKALSAMLGYNSPSSFYRSFQKETGCSPAKYRSEIQKMHSAPEE